MKEAKTVILDGNEAAASVAYRLAEVVAIYPITPSSPMGSGGINGNLKARRTSGARSRSSKNCKPKAVPPVLLHGALQAGAFATTFTASRDFS